MKHLHLSKAFKMDDLTDQPTRFPLFGPPRFAGVAMLRTRALGIGKAPLIWVSAFLVASALGLINLGIVFHARDALLASPAVVGWLAAVWSLGYVCACLLLGPVLARFAPRHLIVASTLGLSAIFWLMSEVASVAALMSLSLLYGVVLSLFWPFLMGWMSTGHEGRQLGRQVARYNLAWCSATVLSPFVCGSLSEYDTRLPLRLASVLVLGVCGLLLSASLALPRIRNDRSHLALEQDAADAAPQGRRTRLRFAAWAGLVVTFFGVGVIAAVFPVSARLDFGLSMFWVGMLMLVRSLFNVIGFVVLGRTERWHFRATPMIAGQLLGVVGFLGLMFATRAGGLMVVWLALCGLGGALSYSCSVFHGVSGSINRSYAMAIHEALLATGLVFGSAVGGMVYQVAGMRLVYGLCAAGIGMVVPAQLLIARWSRREPAVDP